MPLLYENPIPFTKRGVKGRLKVCLTNACNYDVTGHYLRKTTGREDMKEEGKDRDLIWVCPKCSTAYYGWSQRKECEKCGYKESIKPINKEPDAKR